MQSKPASGPPARPPAGFARAGMPANGSVHANGGFQRSAQPSQLPMPRSSPARPAARPQSSHVSNSNSSRSPALSYASNGDDVPLSALRGSTRANITGTASRTSSPRLDWDDETRSPKEPSLVTPQEQYSAHVGVRDQVNSQFETLLDQLQVSDAVRQKFHTVSQDVKTSILHSSITSNPTILSTLGLPVPPKEPPGLRKRLSTPLLRKAKSSSSLGSPNGSARPKIGQTYSVGSDAFTIVASPTSVSSSVFGSPLQPGRSSMDPPPRSRLQRVSAGPRPMSMGLFAQGSNGNTQSFGRHGGRGLGIAMGEQPGAFIEWLGRYKGTDLNMEVGRCKKLRMLLRHESTDWVAEFIEAGGYKLILARLQDLLDVEWREEQHDDQMLYELLRCIKALSTSDTGKSALRSSFPKPFPALSSLLFSEKKPGDLPSRQIIVELWLFLFELFPPVSPIPGRPTSVRFETAPELAEPVDICETIRGLLVPDLPDPRKDQHEFITVAHQPRVFKAWVQELGDICRDYFWIMCHGSNTLWAVDDVDEASVEKPVAPGGATGGVEFEAMNYATIHFRLINTLCTHLAVQDQRKATQLHFDLLSSGMDRILVTMRKASTTYYPVLHLELARYVAHLRAASPKGKLPHLIEKMVGPPPDAMRKRDHRAMWLDMPVGLSTGDKRGGWEF